MGLKEWFKARKKFKEEKNLFYKGDALMDAEDYDGAIKIFDRALELNPQSMQLITSKGLCLLGLCQFNKSIKIFDDGIAVYAFLPNKNSLINQVSVGDCFYNKGICLMNLRKPKEAIESFEILQEGESNWEEGQKRIIECKKMMKKIKKF